MRLLALGSPGRGGRHVGAGRCVVGAVAAGDWGGPEFGRASPGSRQRTGCALHLAIPRPGLPERLPLDKTH
jgi:hypothetical protein